MLPEIALTEPVHGPLHGALRLPAGRVAFGALVGPERGRVWRAAATGEARVIVGARSALFLPFSDLGLIVVDEEHDAGFKQEDRVHYQARDMARGARQPRQASRSSSPRRRRRSRATSMPAPGRYATSSCPAATPAPSCPTCTAIDLRQHPPDKGKWLSPVLVEAVAETLADEAAGAAVPQPPRLRAADAVPLLRPPHRMPAVHGVAGRAPLPRQAALPPLRLLAADAGEVPQVRRAGLARRLRAGRGARRRGGGGALPARRASRCCRPTSCPV